MFFPQASSSVAGPTRRLPFTTCDLSVVSRDAVGKRKRVSHSDEPLNFALKNFRCSSNVWKAHGLSFYPLQTHSYSHILPRALGSVFEQGRFPLTRRASSSMETCFLKAKKISISRVQKNEPQTMSHLPPRGAPHATGSHGYSTRQASAGSDGADVPADATCDTRGCLPDSKLERVRPG